MNFDIFEFRNNTLSHLFFHEQDIKSGLRHRRALKEFLSKLFKKENTPVNSVNIVFCTDPFIKRMNKRFLHHNYFTDTLSFLLSPKGAPVTGEIYISIDTVRTNAIKFGVSYSQELYRVIIHSCLHLCGYEDKPTSNATQMIKRQESYLKQWLVSRGT